MEVLRIKKKKKKKEIYSLFIHYVSTNLQPTSQSHNLKNNDCGHATLNCVQVLRIVVMTF